MLIKLFLYTHKCNKILRLLALITALREKETHKSKKQRAVNSSFYQLALSFWQAS